MKLKKEEQARKIVESSSENRDSDSSDTSMKSPRQEIIRKDSGSDSDFKNSDVSMRSIEEVKSDKSSRSESENVDLPKRPGDGMYNEVLFINDMPYPAIHLYGLYYFDL